MTYDVSPRRLAPAALALLVSLAHASLAGAQSAGEIARRVAAAPDGEVRMTYSTRSNVCGDGGDAVSIGENMTVHRSGISFGRGWSRDRCIAGPARVTLRVEGRRIATVRTSIGGSWASGTTPALDLGRVPAPAAAEFFLSLVPQLGTSSQKDPMLAAAVADSATVSPAMLGFARNASLSRETRRRSAHWAGMLGDASVVAPLEEMARSGEESGGSSSRDDVGPGDGIAGAAVGGLSMVPNGAGVPSLMKLARQGGPVARKAAVFWLGQREEPAARALVRTIAEDGGETEAVRGTAIFVLGEGDHMTSADEAFLRGLFGRLNSDRLKDRALMAISHGESPESVRWLLAQARDGAQSMEVRRKAVFWAGQGHASVAELTALYRAVPEAALREHVIFVLSQKDDEAATTELLSIARNDADRAMRKKAMFWLVQKDDPRVTKLITDIVSR